MTTFRTEVSELSGKDLIVKIESDGKEWWVPEDPANSDYQAYLRWLNGEPELEPIVRDPAPVEEILIQEVITND